MLQQINLTLPGVSQDAIINKLDFTKSESRCHVNHDTS